MGRRFTTFALFYFVFEGKFQVQAPPPPTGSGAYIWGDDLTEGLGGGMYLEGAIHGGAYFRDFTVSYRDFKTIETILSNPIFEN